MLTRVATEEVKTVSMILVLRITVTPNLSSSVLLLFKFLQITSVRPRILHITTSFFFFFNMDPRNFLSIRMSFEDCGK